MTNITRILSLLFVLCFLTSVVSADEPSPLTKEKIAVLISEPEGELYTYIPNTLGLSEKEIRDVTVKALSGRAWKTLKIEDQLVIGYLHHRKTESKVTFKLDSDGINLHHHTFRTNRKGERTRESVPKGWLNNLEKDIIRLMGIAGV